LDAQAGSDQSLIQITAELGESRSWGADALAQMNGDFSVSAFGGALPDVLCRDFNHDSKHKDHCRHPH
jgi:hypothetical protein